MWDDDAVQPLTSTVSGADKHCPVDSASLEAIGVPNGIPEGVIRLMSMPF